LTTEEVERLTNLRERIALQPVHLDLEIAARRLEFARWLVEHGRMDEGFAPGIATAASGWPLKTDCRAARCATEAHAHTTSVTAR
jgi:hypothetical protein